MFGSFGSQIVSPVFFKARHVVDGYGGVSIAKSIATESGQRCDIVFPKPKEQPCRNYFTKPDVWPILWYNQKNSHAVIILLGQIVVNIVVYHRRTVSQWYNVAKPDR